MLPIGHVAEGRGPRSSPLPQSTWPRLPDRRGPCFVPQGYRETIPPLRAAFAEDRKRGTDPGGLGVNGIGQGLWLLLLILGKE